MATNEPIRTMNKEIYDGKVDQGTYISISGRMRRLLEDGIGYLMDNSTGCVVSMLFEPDIQIDGSPLPPVSPEEKVRKVQRERFVQVEGIYNGGRNMSVIRLTYLQKSPFQEQESVKAVVEIEAYNDDSFWKRSALIKINGHQINVIPWMIEKQIHTSRVPLDPAILQLDGENQIEAWVSTYDKYGYDSWLTLRISYQIGERKGEEILFEKERTTRNKILKASIKFDE